MDKRVLTGASLFVGLSVFAQSYQVLCPFGSAGSSTVTPVGQLILVGDTLYGVTSGGGAFGNGSIYSICTNGTGYSVIKEFPAIDAVTSTNTDGAQPMGGLVLCSNRLFGTTFVGGCFKKGTIFNVNTDGTDFAVLNQFNGTNGKNSYASLTLFSNVLYGTTAAGGISNKGTIFKINPDGSEFGTIKSFTSPEGVLLRGEVTADPNGVLYGTTYDGGISNRGTIYSIGSDGSGFTVLRNLSGGDGRQPCYRLLLSGQTLYGVTDGNGVASNSVIYRIRTDGTGYSILKRFTTTGDTNSDGYLIHGGMALCNNVLYGTTYFGGTYREGVVFKINTDGSGYAVLKYFPSAANPGCTNSDGTLPVGDVIVTNGVLYGTTQSGGTYGDGVLYALTLPPIPPLQIAEAGGQPVIWWSDDGLNRVLQTTSDLGGSWTNVPALNWTNIPAPNWTNVNRPQIGLQITNVNFPAGFYRLQ